MPTFTVPRVLIIAGSDSSGGAGIQADVKTLTSLKVYSMTAITAITAQNTNGVSKVEGVSLDMIKKQIEDCVSDIGVDAIKIGMVNKSEIFELIYNTLKALRVLERKIPIVLDPVMFAKGGFPLLEKKAIRALKEFMIKTDCIITPNIPEAENLSGLKIIKKTEMINAINSISKMGVSRIFLKGGHLDFDKLEDYLYYNEKLHKFFTTKVNTKNTHGTGCTISSAITANLAKGYDLYESTKAGHEYVQKSILNAPNLGSGHGPLNHFHFIPD